MNSNNATPKEIVAAFGAIALPDVCSVPQLARHLSIPENTIRDVLRRGDMPGRRIGRRWFIPRNALLAWLADRRVGPRRDR